MSSQPVFIQVGALAEGFAPDSNILPSVDTLNGRTLQMVFSDGSNETFAFPGDGCIRTDTGEFPCRITSIRSGVYLADFVDSSDQSGPTAKSLVIDDTQGLCTALTGRLPDETQARLDAFTRVERGLPLTGVMVNFRYGRIAAPGQAVEASLHHPTTELVGLRNVYTYSATERYEHIYLNENFYAWQCLSGVEAGLADVDRCYTIRIAEKLFLFVWCEKIVPTLGVVMIDLEHMKTDGKIFGYQGNDFGRISNFPVGAFAQVLNTTRYPQ